MQWRVRHCRSQVGTKVIDITEYARTIVKIIKHIEH